MSVRLLFLIMLTVPAQSALGQYEYFESLFGIGGDSESEIISGIEIVEDIYYSWGGGVSNGEFFESFRAYEENGDEIGQSNFVFSNEVVYLGLTNSVLAVPQEGALIYAQARESNEVIRGFLIKADTNLDTLWSSTYDFYDPITYFYSLNLDGDDIITCGEYGVAPGQKGTFLAKLDTDGNLLWYNSLHQPNEGVYRALIVSPMVSGYLVSGAKGLADQTIGYTEFTDLNGNLLWNWESPVSEILGAGMVHTIADDIPIVTQVVLYEDWPFSSNDLLAYSSLRYFEVDFQNENLIQVGEIQTDNEMVTPAMYKTLGGSDGGFITCGSTFKPIGNALHQQSYVLKVDENYELVWYTELAYDPCATCVNTIYDMVRAPDGGYTMAGEFYDTATDPFPRSWLVKVDACGNLVWQGCEPVGINELELIPLIRMFPNPANGFVNFEMINDLEPESVEILDMSGRVVLSVPYTSSLDVSPLGTGIYFLRIFIDEGVIHSEKLIVE